MFEPDPSSADASTRGFTDPPRPIVVDARLLDSASALDDHLCVRLTLIGPAADIDPMPLIATMTTALSTTGLGPDHVRFTPADESMMTEEHDLAPSDLSASPAHAAGIIDRLRIELTSPLFLRHDDRWLSRPSFADLFRASLRTIGQMFTTYAAPLPSDFTALKQAAMGVATRSHNFAPFSQSRTSSRTLQRWEQHGVIGAADFERVPLALLPWLIWAGRWHVGTHRVAGAGGWRVVLP